MGAAAELAKAVSNLKSLKGRSKEKACQEAYKLLAVAEISGALSPDLILKHRQQIDSLCPPRAREIKKAQADIVSLRLQAGKKANILAKRGAARGELARLRGASQGFPTFQAFPTHVPAIPVTDPATAIDVDQLTRELVIAHDRRAVEEARNARTERELTDAERRLEILRAALTAQDDELAVPDVAMSEELPQSPPVIIPAPGSGTAEESPSKIDVPEALPSLFEPPASQGPKVPEAFAPQTTESGAQPQGQPSSSSSEAPATQGPEAPKALPPQTIESQPQPVEQPPQLPVTQDLPGPTLADEGNEPSSPPAEKAPPPTTRSSTRRGSGRGRGRSSGRIPTAPTRTSTRESRRPQRYGEEEAGGARQTHVHAHQPAGIAERLLHELTLLREVLEAERRTRAARANGR